MDDVLAGVPATPATNTTNDDDVLAGVPMDDEAAEEAAAEAAEEAAAEEQERAAARQRQRAAEQLEDVEEEEREAARARQAAAEAEEDALIDEEDAAMSAALPQVPRKSGKRRIIQHTLSAAEIAAAAAGVGGGVQLDEAEVAKRQARAAKFGIEPAPAPSPQAPLQPAAPPVMLTMEEIARREERAKKFEVDISGKDPLASIATLAGTEAFWEQRRDAKPEEIARPEAVHIFGCDRMSTADMLVYFVVPPGEMAEVEPPPPPLWVEWINDSSANVVFADSSAATAALAQRTVPLLPGHEGIDTVTWRTLPIELATLGKGLQLLFRMATVKDVKPAKRAPSRWYGESATKAEARRLSGGGGGGKRTGVADKRADRRATPYGGGGKAASAPLAQARSLAETIALRTAPTDGPTLADMAKPPGPTLADMASGRVVEVVDGPTLADMARAAPPSAPVAATGGDLRSLLKGGGARRKGSFGSDGAGGGGGGGGGDDGGEARGTFSYEAAKAEMAAAMAAEDMGLGAEMTDAPAAADDAAMEPDSTAP